MAKENNEFTIFNTAEKKLPAYETGLKSKLIKPVSPLYSSLKSILIKSSTISTIDNLATTIFENLHPILKELSVLIINYEGVIKNIGNNIEISENIFDLVWECKKFGIEKISNNSIQNLLFYTSFSDDIYLLIVTPNKLSQEEQYQIASVLKNIPNLIGSGI